MPSQIPNTPNTTQSSNDLGQYIQHIVRELNPPAEPNSSKEDTALIIALKDLSSFSASIYLSCKDLQDEAEMTSASRCLLSGLKTLQEWALHENFKALEQLTQLNGTTSPKNPPAPKKESWIYKNPVLFKLVLFKARHAKNKRRRF